MVGRKDWKEYTRYLASFGNVSEPYDQEHRATRYRYMKCSNAEFSPKHSLMHVLPLLCNSDYLDIDKLHGTLVCCGTCGNVDYCDYCIVGSENPVAKEYAIVENEVGFWVSRKIENRLK